MRRWQMGDKVVVVGCDLAFVFDHYVNEIIVQIFIEGQSRETLYNIIYARADALLPNNTEKHLERVRWPKIDAEAKKGYRLSIAYAQCYEVTLKGEIGEGSSLECAMDDLERSL